MNTWLESNCVGCKATNLVDAGDMSDMTIEDIGGFTCYRCGAHNVFDDEGNVFKTNEQQLEIGYPLMDTRGGPTVIYDKDNPRRILAIVDDLEKFKEMLKADF